MNSTEVHVTTDWNTPVTRVDEIQDVSTTTTSVVLFTAPLRLSPKKAFLIGVSGFKPSNDQDIAPPIEDTHENIKRFRTLLIGIFYLRRNTLRGLMLPIEKFGFLDEDVTTMIDDGVGVQPTKLNIVSPRCSFRYLTHQYSRLRS